MVKKNFGVSDKLALAIRNELMKLLDDPDDDIISKNDLQLIAIEFKILVDLRHCFYEDLAFSTKESNAYLGWLHGVVEDVDISYKENLFTFSDPSTVIRMMELYKMKRNTNKIKQKHDSYFLKNTIKPYANTPHDIMMKYSLFHGHLDMVVYFSTNLTGIYEDSDSLNFTTDDDYFLYAVKGGDPKTIDWMLERNKFGDEHNSESRLISLAIKDHPILSSKIYPYPKKKRQRIKRVRIRVCQFD